MPAYIRDAPAAGPRQLPLRLRTLNGTFRRTLTHSPPPFAQCCTSESPRPTQSEIGSAEQRSAARLLLPHSCMVAPWRMLHYVTPTSYEAPRTTPIRCCAKCFKQKRTNIATERPDLRGRCIRAVLWLGRSTAEMANKVVLGRLYCH
jgi:hypothetical protein